MPDKKLFQLNNAERHQVLKKLGYELDDNGFVIEQDTKKEVICRYNGKKVHINLAAILPGSTLVINATPLTMAKYFVEYDYE